MALMVWMVLTELTLLICLFLELVIQDVMDVLQVVDTPIRLVIIVEKTGKAKKDLMEEKNGLVGNANWPSPILC